jgi:hypothetical protein
MGSQDSRWVDQRLLFFSSLIITVGLYKLTTVIIGDDPPHHCPLSSKRDDTGDDESPELTMMISLLL